MRIKGLLKDLMLISPQFWVRILYKDIWNLRKKICVFRQDKRNIPSSCKGNGWKIALYNSYFRQLGCYIGIDAELEDKPVFPDGGPMGVFIRNSAHIGKRCVIFQQVTIGSNMLKDSKRRGALLYRMGFTSVMVLR